MNGVQNDTSTHRGSGKSIVRQCSRVTIEHCTTRGSTDSRHVGTG